MKIAEKALAKVYGEKKIDSERPFKAKLRDGIWHVWGTLYCKDQHGNVITGPCLGGVAIAEVRQRDGRVLNTGHEKYPRWFIARALYIGTLLLNRNITD